MASIVYIPDGCEKICNYAFMNSAVTQIRIPTDCEIGENVFEGCKLVIIFGAPGSEAENYCDEYDNCIFVEE